MSRTLRRLPRALALDALNAASTALAHVVVGAAFLAAEIDTRLADVFNRPEDNIVKLSTIWTLPGHPPPSSA